jgi:hypothetical protein
MGGVARSELVEAVTEAGAYGFLDMLRDARSDRTANRCGSTDPGLLKAELSLRDNDLQNTCARFRCALSLANRF